MKFKSILGLNTVKAFIIVLLSLAIIAVVTLVVLGSLSTTSSNLIPSGTGTVINETVGVMTSSATLTANTFPNCQATVTQVLNKSRVLQPGNYTSIGCAIYNITGEYDDYAWNVSYTYTYDAAAVAGIKSINNNVSNGTITFFGNATTFFALLSVVIIILIISLVVVVVNRFGGGSGEGGNSNPSL